MVGESSGAGFPKKGAKSPLSGPTAQAALSNLIIVQEAAWFLASNTTLMEAEYSWQNLKGSGGYKSEPIMKRYGWWITLAILLSVLLHLVLYVIFEKYIKIPEQVKAAPVTKEARTTRDQVAVDEEMLKSIFEAEQPIPDEQEAVKEMDLTFEEDEPPELPDLPPVVLLTSATDSIVGNFSLDAAALAPQIEMSALDTDITLDTQEADLTAMREELTESANTSVNQPELVLKESDLPTGTDSDELLEEITRNVGGGSGDKIRGRFKGLDSVLIQNGGKVRSGDEFLIPTELLFEFGQYTVREEARLSLMKLGGIILANPNAVFVFKGYTDSITFRPKVRKPGEPSNNVELSERRAEAVKNWIVQSLNLQNEQARMKTVGYGARSPLVLPTGDPTQDRAREAANRRVEIEVISER